MKVFLSPQEDRLPFDDSIVEPGGRTLGGPLVPDTPDEDRGSHRRTRVRGEEDSGPVGLGRRDRRPPETKDGTGPESSTYCKTRPSLAEL